MNQKFWIRVINLISKFSYLWNIGDHFVSNATGGEIVLEIVVRTIASHSYCRGHLRATDNTTCRTTCKLCQTQCKHKTGLKMYGAPIPQEFNLQRIEIKPSGSFPCVGSEQSI